MSVAWANTSYRHRKEVTIDSTEIASNQTDFPLLLKIRDGDRIWVAEVASKRYQIYDHNGSVLDYEEDSYTEGATYLNAEIWVRVPTIYASPSGEQDKVWIYYGHDIGSDQDDAAGTWKAAYLGVWHLNDLTDSSGNGNTLTTATGENAPASGATGQIGGAYSFDDANTEALEVDPWTHLNEPLMLSAWCKSDDMSINQPVVSLGAELTTSPYHAIAVMGAVANDPAYAETNAASFTFSTKVSVATVDTWHLIHGVFATDAARLVVIDDQDGNTDTTSLTVSGLDRLTVGITADSTPQGYFSGDIDEVRVMDENPGADWRRFEYHNQSSADNELTIGKTEHKPGSLVLVHPRHRDNLAAGLVAYYSPTATHNRDYFWRDTSGNGNHGELPNVDPAVDWGESRYGRTLRLPTHTDYMATGLDLGTPDTLTIHVVTYVTTGFTGSGGGYLFDATPGAAGVALRTGSGGDNLDFFVYRSTGGLSIVNDISHNVGNGKWAAFTCVMEPTRIVLYKNGVAIGTDDSSTGPMVDGGNIVIGAEQSGDGGITDITFASAIIWSRDLSASEVSLLAHNPLILEDPGPEDWALWAGAAMGGAAPAGGQPIQLRGTTVPFTRFWHPRYAG